jgi:hypothetical protein
MAILTLESPLLTSLPDVSVLWAFISVVFGSYLFSILSLQFRGPKAPLVGIRSFFEPRFMGNYRFFRDGKAIIDEGYQKVKPFPSQSLRVDLYMTQGKDKPYKFVRNDADIVVLPVKYVEEVRAMPNTVANPTLAHAHNLLSTYTDTGVILRNNLHFRVIQNKMTPNLGSLSVPMQDELNYAMSIDFPECKGKKLYLNI